MGVSELVGRERELARVGAAVDAVTGGTTRVLLISGEPGIGKTALLDALHARAAAAGLDVLAARAAEQEREIPFALAIAALEEPLAALHPSRAAALDPELAAVFDVTAATASAAQRFRLHRALRGLLEALATPAPVALVLDDLHWSDQASLEWVLHALRRPAGRPHLIVLATRAVAPLPLLVEALRGVAGAEHLAVEPLADDAAHRLLGGVPEARRNRLVAEAGGNPLFLEGLARSTGEDLPTTVLAAVGQEVATLPPAARTLLEGAAVAGDPFSAELAAVAADLDADADAALDRLAATGLVVPTEGGRLRFRHPLVRRAVYDAAPAGWRLSAHGRLAAALAARGVDAVGRAHHVEHAAAVGDTEAAGALARAAWETAQRDPAAAARWFRAALRLDPGASAESRAGLMAGLAQALAAAGRPVEAREAMLEALAAQPRELASSPDAVPIRLELIAATAAVEHVLGRHDDAVARVIHALDGVPDPPAELRARLDYELAIGALFRQDLATLGGLGGRSAAALRSTEPALAAADDALGVIAALWSGRPADVPAALAQLRGAVAALDRDAVLVRPEVLFYAGYAELFLENVRECIGLASDGLTAIREGGQDRMLVPVATMHAMACNTAGDQHAAVETAAVAEEAARLQGLDYPLHSVLWVRALIEHTRGEQALALRLADECAQLMDRLGETIFTVAGRCNLASIHVDDDPQRTVREIDLHAGPGFASLDPTWGTYLIGTYVRALLALDRPDDARAATAVLEARARESGLAMGRGRAHHARAEVALHGGSAAAAVTDARVAVAIADERGYGMDAVRAELTLGRALGRQGDREGAVMALRAASRRAAAGGMYRFRDIAARELRRLGSRLESDVEVAGDVFGLTDRERQIADHVVAGRSNKEIAALLFLSPKTVEHTLTRVYAKAGVRSRTALGPALHSAA